MTVFCFILNEGILYPESRDSNQEIGLSLFPYCLCPVNKIISNR
jgi:hypothetical protein